MQTGFSKKASYNSTIAFLSFMTALCGFGCTLFGYILLPFAAAYYAMLVWYERSERRILTYIIPVILYIINFLINGLYSLEAIAYVAVGLLICLSYKAKKSKGETAFWSVLLIVALLSVSAIFLAFNASDKANSSAITEFYTLLYETYKDKFVELVTSITTADESGILFFAYNAYQAGDLFKEFIIVLIPMAIIAAFLMSGIALKLFTSGMRKYSGDEKKLNLWSFRTTNLIAYFYILIAILSVFSSGSSDIFAVSVSVLNTIFAVIFAYVGFTFIYGFISRARGSFFAVAVLVIACMLFSSFALQLLSYIGVYYTIVANKVINRILK